MSLLGVDVGTTGCKASAFSAEGGLLASAYREYDVQRSRPGYAELDSAAVWGHIQAVIGETRAQTQADPVTALAVSSLGEAVVPVTRDREILGPSLLNFDERGAEYLGALDESFEDARLYGINGNPLGNHYSLTKLLWLRDHAAGLYERTYKFLHWGAFVSFMLGADPVVDHSLANRTLLFDLDRATWSDELMASAGIDRDKLPDTAPSGTVIGTVSDTMAAALGLPRGVAIVTGAHDQCANAVGCGATEPGRAMFGFGTYVCVVPVFTKRQDPAVMLRHGFNTEHHAVPGRFVSFIYNHGGSLLKWYRDTFAAAERDAAGGQSVYPALLGEMPEAPSSVVVLPHFAQTGPPEFVADSSGVMAGLRLETTRGDALKGILEGVVFYLRACMAPLPATGMEVASFRAVGGGSRSDAWLQLAADILGHPLTRARLTESGALGGAVLAGAATGVFDSAAEGAEAMVALGETFEPRGEMQRLYDARFAHYARLWPLMRDYLRELAHT